MISVVPEHITSVTGSTDLSFAYDRQLLDPQNNSVSLSVPLEVSVRIVKANYKEEYTRTQIIDTNPTPIAIGICPPFTINAQTKEKVVVIDMEQVATSEAGFAVSAISGNTSEDGGQATFLVKLISQPTANVEIELSSSDESEGSISPSTLTFTTENWNTNQLVTVTGVDDEVADGNQSYTVILGAATSSDASYNGLDPDDMPVINIDDDSVGFVISNISGNTAEDGSTATFTIRLNSEPTDEVTIAVSSSDATEGTVAPTSLTFTSGNWDADQTVTVTGVADAVEDGDVAYNIVLSEVTSSDSLYDGKDPEDVNVTNLNIDVTAPNVSSVSPLDTATDVSVGTSIAVRFDEPMTTATLTTNTDTTCSGTLQVPDDGFSTCVAMDSTIPVASNSDQTFTVTPASDLDDLTIYKIRVIIGVQDTSGNALAAQYTTSTGFTTTDLTPPTVSSVSPADGSSGALISTSISVTFDEAMNTFLISTNTGTACNAKLQVSADDFSTCVAMESTTPTVSNGDRTFTINPASDLSYSTTYKIRATTDVKDPFGNYLASVYTTTTGFTTEDPPDTTPPSIVSATPEDTAIDIVIYTDIEVTFDEEMNSSTITTNTSDTACFGTIQLSIDGFTTCIQMSSAPVASNGNQTFTFTPDSNLAYNTAGHKVKVTTGVEDIAGNPLAAAYEQTTGFTTQVERLLPDTGQTTNYDGTFGEDHNYINYPPSYTNNGDGTVTDNNTLLMWQRDDVNTLRYWADADNYCQNSTLAGYTDWRMPFIKELASIIDFSQYSPTINTTAFPNTVSSLYWSANYNYNYLPSTDTKWYVDFEIGQITSYVNNGALYQYYVRCVRGGSDSDLWSLDFVDNGDGTISHQSTGLMWAQDDDDTGWNWWGAMISCEDSTLAGYSDWRLPNVREYQTINNYSLVQPSLDNFFMNINAAPHWTSTTYVNYTDNGWLFSFQGGGTITGAKSTYPGYARCVRGLITGIVTKTTTQQAYIKTVNGIEQDGLYQVLAISGDTIALGRRMEDSTDNFITNGTTAGANTGKAASGAIYVYKPVPTGLRKPLSRLTTVRRSITLVIPWILMGIRSWQGQLVKMAVIQP